MPQEVCEITQSMKNKKFSGTDDIPLKLLKYSKDSNFANLFVELCQFSDELKMGKIYIHTII